MEKPTKDPYDTSRVKLTDRWRTSNLHYLGKTKAKALDWHIGQDLLYEDYVDDGVWYIVIAPLGKHPWHK